MAMFNSYVKLSEGIWVGFCPRDFTQEFPARAHAESDEAGSERADPTGGARWS